MEEVDRLDRILARLLAFGRPALEDRALQPLAPLIDRAVAMVHTQSEQKGLSIEVEAGEAPPPQADVDGLQVEQVVINLLLNAIEASPAGGTVRVGLEREDEFVRIEVSDDGLGIPDNAREHVFDPYFTTRDAGNRSGPGRLPGGRGPPRRLASLRNRRRRNHLHDAAADAAGRHMSAGPKILIAEDDARAREYLCTLLKDEGYEVETAADGTEAWRLLLDARFEGLLLDVQMPGKDGLTILRELQSVAQPPAVLVMTAYGSSSVAIEAMKLGAYDYLTKPLHFDELLIELARAVAARGQALELEAYQQRRPGRGREPSGGQRPRHAAGLQAHRPGRPDRLDGADPRRDRHRQGAGRPGAPRPQHPRRPAARRA